MLAAFALIGQAHKATPAPREARSGRRRLLRLFCYGVAGAQKPLALQVWPSSQSSAASQA